MGLGAFPAPHDAVARDARDARHARRQLRDGRGRPDLRDRRPLRRPHHRQAVASSRRARSSSTSTSTRPRSPRTSRRTSRSSATPRAIVAKLIDGVPRARRPTAARLEEWWQRIERLAVTSTRSRYERLRRTARSSRSGWSRRSTRRPSGDAIVDLRRRPAPDVGGAVLPLPRAAPLDQLRRAGDDGLRPAGRDGRQGRLPGRDGRLRRRRRLDPDERAGAGDLRARRASTSRSSS